MESLDARELREALLKTAPEPGEEATLLLDCGLAQTPARVVAPALRRLGVRDEDVRHVVVTHADVDHAGGLGAALQATSLPFGVVNAPGQRYHPAIVAQAMATLGQMFPGRFWAALGSGGPRSHPRPLRHPRTPAPDRLSLQLAAQARSTSAADGLSSSDSNRFRHSATPSCPAARTAATSSMRVA